MFDKFTERARRVMNTARQEAQKLNHEFIGSEHILLGIVQEGGGVAAKVLKNLNVDFKRVRHEIERLIQPNPTLTVTLGYLPFSPRAKHVLELAQEAAAKLNHEIVGTEHLLIGLLKEAEGVGAIVLLNLGVRMEEVHDMVLDLLGAEYSVVAGEAKSVGRLVKMESTETVTAEVSKTEWAATSAVIAGVRLLACKLHGKMFCSACPSVVADSTYIERLKHLDSLFTALDAVRISGTECPLCHENSLCGHAWHWRGRRDEWEAMERVEKALRGLMRARKGIGAEELEAVHRAAQALGNLDRARAHDAEEKNP